MLRNSINIVQFCFAVDNWKTWIKFLFFQRKMELNIKYIFHREAILTLRRQEIIFINWSNNKAARAKNDRSYNTAFLVLFQNFSFFFCLYFHQLQWRWSSFYTERVMRSYITVKAAYENMSHTASRFFSRDPYMNKTTTSQTWHLIHACKSNPISIIHSYRRNNVLLE